MFCQGVEIFASAAFEKFRNVLERVVAPISRCVTMYSQVTWSVFKEIVGLVLRRSEVPSCGTSSGGGGYCFWLWVCGADGNILSTGSVV